MSELGDLLELVYGAAERWRTARLTMREWHDTRRTRAAVERLLQRQSDGGMTGRMVAFGVGGPEPDRVEHVVRTWLDGERAREEREGPYAVPLAVRVGDRWWQYSPEHGASSNEAEPGTLSGIGEAALALLDPAHLLGSLWLEPAGELVAAGRPGLLVRCAPRNREHGFGLHRLGFGAQAYELVVDRERGVLLRTTSLFDGEPMSGAEVLELAFDEDFPPGTFEFELPEGETFRPLFPRPEHVTLERAAERAPFTVLAPAEVPAGWQLHVLLLAGEERPPQPPSVTLHYHSRDAGEQLSILETSAEADEPHVWLAWEDAGEALVAGPAEPRGLEPGYARVERDGTRATLSSAELPRERLVALARSLGPVQPAR